MKLDKIRLATEEEVKVIVNEADLTATSRVLQMDNMTAVWRVCNELDPVMFRDASNSKKYFFLWGLENILRGHGANEVYFNIKEKDTEFQGIAEHFGAERVSKEPEYRYKIVL